MDPFTPDELPEEYAELADPPKVMAEVVAVVDELHRASTELGNAIAAAGLPARRWRSDDARLPLLSDEFPEITLDFLLSRLAEFAAGNGPAWLRSDAAAIADFNDEAQVLSEVVRPLHARARYLRTVPARDRELPMERALGDGRVGTKLDIVYRCLNDLEALGPFIRPLSPAQWQTLPAPVAEPAPRSAPPVASPAPASARAPRVKARAAAPQPSARFAGSAPASQAAEQGPIYLNDLARNAVNSVRLTMSRALEHARPYARQLSLRQWLVVAVAIAALGSGTALLALASHGSTTSLAASPANLALACHGKTSSLTLTLSDTGTSALTWSASVPTGLSLSATHGSLKPGAFIKLAVHATAAKTAQGTLSFASNLGDASVPYTVTCS
jgi:hypothetical protein